MKNNNDVELLTLMDYFDFEKRMIAILHDYDEDEDDMRGLKDLEYEDYEEVVADIRENAEDRMHDYIYDLLKEEGDEGKKGQLLCKLFENKDVDETEGVKMFKKYKEYEAEYDEGYKQEDWEELTERLDTNIFDAKYEEEAIDTAVKEYESVKEEGGDLNRFVNGIPLVAIEQIIKAIIWEYLDLDEETKFHFEMNGGWCTVTFDSEDF